MCFSNFYMKCQNSHSADVRRPTTLHLVMQHFIHLHTVHQALCGSPHTLCSRGLVYMSDDTVNINFVQVRKLRRQLSHCRASGHHRCLYALTTAVLRHRSPQIQISAARKVCVDKIGSERYPPRYHLSFFSVKSANDRVSNKK